MEEHDHFRSKLTLRSLVNWKMQEKGLTRVQLVAALGYSNKTKGLRRLDFYLATLQPPSVTFVSQLLKVLEIDGVLFFQAVLASWEQTAAEEKLSFKPYLELGINFRPGGWIASQFIHNQCLVPTPDGIQQLPFQQELEVVVALYQERSRSLNFHKDIIGFRYHREYEYYLEYDLDLILKYVNLRQHRQQKMLFGNRVVDMLIASSRTNRHG